MRAKEEILDYCLGNANEESYDGLNPIQEMRVLEAMDIYAKEVAIAFAEWMNKRDVTYSSLNEKWELPDIWEGFTSEELFNKFLTEKTV